MNMQNKSHPTAAEDSGEMFSDETNNTFGTPVNGNGHVTGNGNSNGNGDNAHGGDAKKKTQILIREMTIDDLAPVFHLGEEIFTADTSPNLYRTWDEYEVTSLFLEDSDLCIVAEMEKKVVGFVMGTTIEKRHSSWKYGYLIWLGVSPECQKQGVAHRLFKAFHNLMLEEEVRMILVDTEANNQKALRFFQRLGFVKPRRHIYLSMNLDQERKHSKK